MKGRLSYTAMRSGAFNLSVLGKDVLTALGQVGTPMRSQNEKADLRSICLRHSTHPREGLEKVCTLVNSMSPE